MDRILQDVCAALTRDSAHTILLYGSRADGTANEFSDYDVAAFADVPATTRDTRRVDDGQFLDVFLHPEAVLRAPTQELLSLRGSTILLQRGTEAADFLAGLDEIFARGPEPLAPDEIEARHTWAKKMSLRMRRGDIEGDFRRVWLLTALLEDYFVIRGMWYQGPKKSSEWLRNSDAPTYRAFEEALEPGASFDAIDHLVALATDAQLSATGPNRRPRAGRAYNCVLSTPRNRGDRAIDRRYSDA